MLFYTDGVTEEMNPKGELYGEARLINFLKNVTPRTAQLTLDALVEDVEKFRAAAPQHDDITAVVIYVKK